MTTQKEHIKEFRELTAIAKPLIEQRSKNRSMFGIITKPYNFRQHNEMNVVFCITDTVFVNNFVQSATLMVVKAADETTIGAEVDINMNSYLTELIQHSLRKDAAGLLVDGAFICMRLAGLTRKVNWVITEDRRWPS